MDNFIENLNLLTNIQLNSIVTFKSGKCKFRGKVLDFTDTRCYVEIINKFGHTAHTHKQVPTEKIIKVDNPSMVHSADQ